MYVALTDVLGASPHGTDLFLDLILFRRSRILLHSRLLDKKIQSSLFMKFFDL